MDHPTYPQTNQPTNRAIVQKVGESAFEAICKSIPLQKGEKKREIRQECRLGAKVSKQKKDINSPPNPHFSLSDGRFLRLLWADQKKSLFDMQRRERQNLGRADCEEQRPAAIGGVSTI